MRDAILAAILSLPGVDPSAAPVAADAIAAVAPTHERAARLIALGYFESRFLGRIQKNDCRFFVRHGVRLQECDAGRARSFWQFQRTSLAPEWHRSIGLGFTQVRTAATVADRILERGMRSCGNETGAFARYATGASCRWRGAARRAHLSRAILRRLEP